MPIFMALDAGKEVERLKQERRKQAIAQETAVKLKTTQPTQGPPDIAKLEAEVVQRHRDGDRRARNTALKAGLAATAVTLAIPGAAPLAPIVGMTVRGTTRMVMEYLNEDG